MERYPFIDCTVHIKLSTSNYLTVKELMAYYAEALEYFGHSLQLYDPNASTVYKMGMCQYNLRNLEAALEYVSQALELDPDFEPARKMRMKIKAEITRQNLLQFSIPLVRAQHNSSIPPAPQAVCVQAQA